MTAAPAPSSELRTRVLSGLVMAAAAIGSNLLGGAAYALVWAFAAAYVAFEWQRMAHGAGGRSIEIAAVAAALAAAAGAADVLPSWLALAAAASLTFAAAAAGPAALRAMTATGVVYASAFGVAAILCRATGREGAVVVFWLFAAVWGTDVCAYFAGRALGGPKLWPSVSPRKTWSGAIGGLCGGVLLSAALLGLAGIALRWQHIALAAAFSVLTQAGDLYESAMKRRFGVKDSGRSIPGHGGFMDRLDGYIFAVVVAAAVGAARAGPGHAPSGLLVWP